MQTRTRVRPVKRLPLLLCLLAIALVAGVLHLLRGPAFREYRLGRMSAAELRAWTASRPSDALAHYYLGLDAHRRGKADEAAAAYLKALDLDPTLTRAASRMAGLLVANGQYRAAENLLQQAAQVDPAAAEIYMGLGQIFEARQDFRRAVDAWRMATALAPKDAGAWYHLGRCWMGLNEEARALPAYRSAVELAPLQVEHQKAVAGALRLVGDYARAERHCRRALLLRPDDPEAHFERMKILRDRDGTTPQAEESMRAAVRLQPENPQFRYYLGSLLQERGRLEPAAEEYASALRLFPAHRPRGGSTRWTEWSLWFSYLEGAHFNQARVLQRLGRPKEAQDHLAQFQRLSRYHIRANQLFGQVGNRPGDAGLRFALARLHADAGYPALAEEQYRAGLRIRQDPRAQAELKALQKRPAEAPRTL